jgi:hypothetical protein
MEEDRRESEHDERSAALQYGGANDTSELYFYATYQAVSGNPNCVSTLCYGVQVRALYGNQVDEDPHTVKLSTKVGGRQNLKLA